MAGINAKEHVPIFVSSTYEDLIPYREEAQRVLIRLEQLIKGMEYFGSNAAKPLDVCLKNVRESKIFVGIIGMRYGSIEPETGKSYTQLEYEEAIRNNIPTLIYIISNDCAVLPKYIDFGDSAEKLQSFKKHLVRNHTVYFFTSVENFGLQLLQDLTETLEHIGHAGIIEAVNEKEKQNYDEVFLGFIKRPAKYSGREIWLEILVSNKEKTCGRLKPSVVTALGMTLGDAISVPVYVEKDNQLLYDQLVYLYGEKELGDWIEGVPPKTKIKVKVRLEYTVTKELSYYDSGAFATNVGYYNLVLLDYEEPDK